MKCLIVSDNLKNTKAVEKYVDNIEQINNMNVAINFDIAMHRLNKFTFEFVIIDLVANKDDNLKLIEWIRTSNIDVEIVLLTSECSKDYIKCVFRYGVSDYIIKPFSSERLNEAVNRVMLRRTYLDEFKYLNQQEIDRYICIVECKNLPKDHDKKGISKQTLKVVEDILVSELDSFTATSIAEKSGLSRITVRRYLENMVSSGDLSTDFIYGDIGRPQKAYKKTK